MATNRPDTLDPALLRPGRLDRKVEFGLPDLESRTQIFQIHTRAMACERDVRFELLGRLCPNSTGADIRSVCTEAVGLVWPGPRAGADLSAGKFLLCTVLCRLQHSASAGGHGVCLPAPYPALLAAQLQHSGTQLNRQHARVEPLTHPQGMFAIRARRKTVTEKDFLDAVNKVIKGYQKFSATPKYMVYN
jgi:ATP-dependent 26S proteasome regulatory subunit